MRRLGAMSVKSVDMLHRVGTGLVQLWWAEYFMFGLVWLDKFGCFVAVWLIIGRTKMHNSPLKLANSYKIGITSGVKYNIRPVYSNLIDLKTRWQHVLLTYLDFNAICSCY